MTNSFDQNDKVVIDVGMQGICTSTFNFVHGNNIRSRSHIDFIPLAFPVTDVPLTSYTWIESAKRLTNTFVTVEDMALDGACVRDIQGDFNHLFFHVNNFHIINAKDLTEQWWTFINSCLRIHPSVIICGPNDVDYIAQNLKLPHELIVVPLYYTSALDTTMTDCMDWLDLLTDTCWRLDAVRDSIVLGDGTLEAHIRSLMENVTQLYFYGQLDELIDGEEECIDYHNGNLLDIIDTVRDSIGYVYARMGIINELVQMDLVSIDDVARFY